MFIDPEIGYLLAIASVSSALVYLLPLFISREIKTVEELSLQKKEIEDLKITAFVDTRMGEFFHSFWLQKLEDAYVFDKKEYRQFLNMRGVMALIGFIFCLINTGVSVSFVVVTILFLFLSVSAFWRMSLVPSK